MSDGSRRARASSPTRLPLRPARFPGKVAILCPLTLEHVLWDRKHRRRELVSIQSCPQTHSNDFELELIEPRRSVSQISHSPKVWCLSLLSLLSLSPLSRPSSSKQLTLALAPATTSGAADGTQFCPCRYPTVTNRHHLLGHQWPTHNGGACGVPDSLLVRSAARQRAPCGYAWQACSY